MVHGDTPPFEKREKFYTFGVMKFNYVTDEKISVCGSGSLLHYLL